MPRDFLEQALINRTRQESVRWDMLLTIGEPGDPQDDPTILWPKDRKELNVGTLTISSAMAQPGAGCEKINFDPLVMADGIAATNDPVLLFRSPSYAVSFTKRRQGSDVVESDRKYYWPLGQQDESRRVQEASPDR
jgi:catalase